jgi:hypothetical protein
MFTNYQNGVTSFGIPQIGGAIPPTTGPCYVIGTDTRFIQPDYPLIQSGINALGDYGGTLLIQPGSYDEAVAIVRSSTTTAAPICLVGMGNKGSCAIETQTADLDALTNDRDNVTLINLGLAALGTGKALVNTGSRFQAWGSKMENDDGTGECAQMTLGTVAQRAAHTKGGGADCLLASCEFAWAASGIEIVCTDYGAVTELRIINSLFHDLDTNHIYETVGSGGSAGVMYATLLLQGNTHMKDEAGTAPTAYVLLDGDNANTGVMTQCVFPQAVNGGLVLLSTALVSVCNFFTGGISTAQPS